MGLPFQSPLWEGFSHFNYGIFRADKINALMLNTSDSKDHRYLTLGIFSSSKVTEQPSVTLGLIFLESKIFFLCWRSGKWHKSVKLVHVSVIDADNSKRSCTTLRFFHLVNEIFALVELLTNLISRTVCSIFPLCPETMLSWMESQWIHLLNGLHRIHVFFQSIIWF